MKVSGTGGPAATGGPKGAKPGSGAGGGFRLPSVGAAQGAAPSAGVGGVAGVMGLDALLALQDVGGPLERRRRAVRRAGRILDVLDEVKVALLGGELSTGELERLSRALREERSNTDDPGLEAVLDEIELRAAVELAKLEQHRHAA